MMVTRVKTFVSTKAEYLDERVNEFLDHIYSEGACVDDIRPFLSCIEKSAKATTYKPITYVGCQITYVIEKEIQHQETFDLFSGTNEEYIERCIKILKKEE